MPDGFIKFMAWASKNECAETYVSSRHRVNDLTRIDDFEALGSI